MTTLRITRANFVAEIAASDETGNADQFTAILSIDDLVAIGVDSQKLHDAIYIAIGADAEARAAEWAATADGTPLIPSAEAKKVVAGSVAERVG